MTVVMATGVYAHSLSISGILGKWVRLKCTAGGLSRPSIEFMKLDAKGFPVPVKQSLPDIWLLEDEPMRNRTLYLALQYLKRD
jgi:hypothetical protein